MPYGSVLATGSGTVTCRTAMNSSAGSLFGTNLNCCELIIIILMMMMIIIIIIIQVQRRRND